MTAPTTGEVTGETITTAQIRELCTAAASGRWGYGYGHTREPTGRRNAFTRALFADCGAVLESRHNIAMDGIVTAYNRFAAWNARHKEVERG